MRVIVTGRSGRASVHCGNVNSKLFIFTINAALVFWIVAFQTESFPLLEYLLEIIWKWVPDNADSTPFYWPNHLLRIRSHFQIESQARRIAKCIIV